MLDMVRVTSKLLPLARIVVTKVKVDNGTVKAVRSLRTLPQHVMGRPVPTEYTLLARTHEIPRSFGTQSSVVINSHTTGNTSLQVICSSPAQYYVTVIPKTSPAEASSP